LALAYGVSALLAARAVWRMSASAATLYGFWAAIVLASGLWFLVRVPGASSSSMVALLAAAAVILAAGWLFIRHLVQKFGNSWPATSDDGFAIRLKIHEAWKGEAKPDLIMYTPRDEAGCGLPMVSGQRYLIYARRDETRTMRFLSAAELGCATREQRMQQRSVHLRSPRSSNKFAARDARNARAREQWRDA
jgi:hypothetical protein